MIADRTFVGLDVHARSVVACAVDAVTGEVSRARLTPQFEELWRWLQGFAGPVAVAYEAGPIGFGGTDSTWNRAIRNRPSLDKAVLAEA